MPRASLTTLQMVGVGPRLLAPVVKFHLISWVDRWGKVDHAAHRATTSSDTEVVGDLLLSAFAAERRDGIPQSVAPSV